MTNQENLKPHMWYQQEFEEWACHLDDDQSGITGWGKTPILAYRQWRAAMAGAFDSTKNNRK